MEVFGKVGHKNAGRGISDIAIHVQAANGDINISIRNKDMFDLQYILLGFEGSRLYFLDGSMTENALHVTASSGDIHYVKSRHPEVKKRLTDCVGKYVSFYNKQKKAYYIVLKNIKKEDK